MKPEEICDMTTTSSTTTTTTTTITPPTTTTRQTKPVKELLLPLPPATRVPSEFTRKPKNFMK